MQAKEICLSPLSQWLGGRRGGNGSHREGGRGRGQAHHGAPGAPPTRSVQNVLGFPFVEAHVLEFAHLVLPLMIACPWASHSACFFFCKMGIKIAGPAH